MTLMGCAFNHVILFIYYGLFPFMAVDINFIVSVPYPKAKTTNDRRWSLRVGVHGWPAFQDGLAPRPRLMAWLDCWWRIGGYWAMTYMNKRAVVILSQKENWDNLVGTPYWRLGCILSRWYEQIVFRSRNIVKFTSWEAMLSAAPSGTSITFVSTRLATVR